MKHGSIAMIDKDFIVVAISPVDSVYEKITSNIEEIKARREKIIAITIKGNKNIKHIANYCFYISKKGDLL